MNWLALIFADLFGFILSFLVAACLWNTQFKGVPFECSAIIEAVGPEKLMVYSAVVMMALLWIGGHLHHYSWRKPFWGELRELLLLLLALSASDLALTAISKWNFSRGLWLMLWSWVIILVPLCRYLLRVYLLQSGGWRWSCLIIGAGANARDAYQALRCETLMGVEAVAFVAINDEHDVSPVADIPLLNIDMAAVAELYGHLKLFIAVESSEQALGEQWLRFLAARGIRNISLIPPLRGIPMQSADSSYFFSHQMLSFQVKNNLVRWSSRLLKRSFDVLISSALLLLLSPFLLWLVVKVRQDGGPAIYGHQRIGYGGKPFACLKFRSMLVNADEVLATLLATDAVAQAEWQRDFKLRNDPRITAVGHFLRRTSLDELPQLWNVLRGDMSLVGPRPVIAEELSRYAEDAEYYLMAKPGMTGLWQVSGRNDLDYQTRVYMDGWYVKNWSLWYDMAILCNTVSVVLRRDGAY